MSCDEKEVKRDIFLSYFILINFFYIHFDTLDKKLIIIMMRGFNNFFPFSCRSKLAQRDPKVCKDTQIKRDNFVRA